MPSPVYRLMKATSDLAGSPEAASRERLLYQYDSMYSTSIEVTVMELDLRAEVGIVDAASATNVVLVHGGFVDGSGWPLAAGGGGRPHRASGSRITP
jgi:hypothetical protein